MSVNYYYLTGTPSQVWSNTVRTISACVRGCGNFKIGITNAPERRWREEHSYRYNDMIVLYRSASIDNVSMLESALIDYYLGSCDNVIAGGGGGIGPPPYYLYLVRTY